MLRNCGVSQSCRAESGRINYHCRAALLEIERKICNKAQNVAIAGKIELNCRQKYGMLHAVIRPFKSLQFCRPTAGIKLAIFLQGCRARLPGKAAGQGCRARLPGKAVGQGCQARLPGKAAGQGCRARLPGKAGCRARLPGKAAMV
jgi:hypothetical protein